jgi:hypothetical protein
MEITYNIVCSTVLSNFLYTYQARLSILSIIVTHYIVITIYTPRVISTRPLTRSIGHYLVLVSISIISKRYQLLLSVSFEDVWIIVVSWSSSYLLVFDDQYS